MRTHVCLSVASFPGYGLVVFITTKKSVSLLQRSSNICNPWRRALFSFFLMFTIRLVWVTFDFVLYGTTKRVEYFENDTINNLIHLYSRSVLSFPVQVQRQVWQPASTKSAHYTEKWETHYATRCGASSVPTMYHHIFFSFLKTQPFGQLHWFSWILVGRY